MAHITFLLVVVIITSMSFDYTNGFHDTANAIATSIAFRALPPRDAKLDTADLNQLGAYKYTQLANTSSGGIVKEGQITLGMI